VLTLGLSGVSSALSRPDRASVRVVVVPSAFRGGSQLLIPQLVPVSALFGCFAASFAGPPVGSPGQALPAPPDLSRSQLAG